MPHLFESERGVCRKSPEYVFAPPHEEIIRVRISRFKELLAETELSLAEIAERTGFNHVEYLSATFKKKVGLPPSRFREQNRK